LKFWSISESDWEKDGQDLSLAAYYSSHCTFQKKKKSYSSQSLSFILFQGQQAKAIHPCSLKIFEDGAGKDAFFF
jgi:hypothetical protein